MTSEPQAPLLDTPAVMARYGLQPRAARRIMDDAGALKAAGRLYVRLDDLVAWEEHQRAARRPATMEPARQITRRPARRRATIREPLPEFFWQQSSSG